MTSSVTDVAVEALKLAIDELNAWMKCATERGLCITSTPDVVDHLQAVLSGAALAPPPVSELVTVQYEVFKNDKWHSDHPMSWERRKLDGATVRELVTRDQAEAREADLLRQLEIANRNRDAARENFLTMQKTAETLLRRAEAAEAKLAAHGQEPVAHQWRSRLAQDGWSCWYDGKIPVWIVKGGREYEERPLYTAPQPDRRAVLEDAALAAEQFRDKDWIAHDMRTGVFPERSKPGTAIAAVIRALKEQP